MKLDPLVILLNKNFKLDKKYYFISGNENTLIDKIKLLITENFKKEGGFQIKYVDSIANFIDEISLFGDQNIFVAKNCKDINEKNLNNLKNSKGIFIFIQENSQKTKVIKSLFIKDKDSYLIDCYELDRDAKIKILNNYLEANELSFEKNLYWFLIEKLDNRYIFLENTLKRIFELDEKDITILNIKKILTIDDTGGQKLFLSLFKKNREILVFYREKIVTLSDVYELYYYCKFFCQLIIDCNNEREYDKKIPIYLFKEKKTLIDIYKKYNSRKKKLLIELLSTTEKGLRKHGDLSLVFGLRFLLNIKKITIS